MNFDKKYLYISFLFHLIILIFLFSISFDNKINKSFIVFGPRSSVPTHAYFKPLRLSKNSGGLNISQGTISGQKKVAKINNSQKKNTKSKEQPNKKEVKPKKQSKREQPKKPEIKKTQPKKNEVKKEEPKKIPEKKIPEKKQAIIKEDQKKKNLEKKEKEKIEEVQRSDIEQKKEVIEKEEKVIEEEKIIEQEEIYTFDLIGGSDPKLYEYQKKHIQKAVVALWRPPVGVPKGTEASVGFIVDKKGEIKEFEMIKEPNNLLYKLSIIRVAKKFEFDKSLWGKRFNIVFRQ
ncbi:MAG: hypothetical protein ABIA74_04495 [bacterium]